MADVLAAPERLKDGIGKAQHQQVLHHLLAQVVIDAEGLRFVAHPGQGELQLIVAGAVAAKRLFHHQPRPGLATAARQEPALRHGARRLAEHERRHGQVDDAVGARAAFQPGQPRIRSRKIGDAVVFAAAIMAAAQELSGQHRTGAGLEFLALQSISQAQSKGRVGELCARQPHKPHIGRQVPACKTGEQRREQLAPRQVARGANNQNRNGSFIHGTSPQKQQAIANVPRLLTPVKKDGHKDLENCGPVRIQRRSIKSGLGAPFANTGLSDKREIVNSTP